MALNLLLGLASIVVLGVGAEWLSLGIYYRMRKSYHRPATTA